MHKNRVRHLHSEQCVAHDSSMLAHSSCSALRTAALQCIAHSSCALVGLHLECERATVVSSARVLVDVLVKKGAVDGSASRYHVRPASLRFAGTYLGRLCVGGAYAGDCAGIFSVLQ